MKFIDVMLRLTGVSCPVFGVSWNPAEPQRNIAKRIIIFLEGRRVLFEVFGVEALCQCIESVTKIKDFLTSELPNIDDDSDLNSYVRGMRKACNKFLSSFPQNKQDKCKYCHEGTEEYWCFVSSIGELRGIFGIMIGQIAKSYGLDVEDELAQIIPE